MSRTSHLCQNRFRCGICMWMYRVSTCSPSFQSHFIPQPFQHRAHFLVCILFSPEHTSLSGWRKYRRLNQSRDHKLQDMWTPHLTRRIFSYNYTQLRGSRLKSCVCRARIICHPHVFVLTRFDYSTFLSLLTIFSLIILSFLLPINFIFHGVVDRFPVHSC